MFQIYWKMKNEKYMEVFCDSLSIEPIGLSRKMYEKGNYYSKFSAKSMNFLSMESIHDK